MPTHYVISIMTRDRVGIIADVSRAIRDLGGNLADLSQTVLCDYFTMIITASFPEAVTGADIRAALAAIDPQDPFEVGVKRRESAAPPAAAAAKPGSRAVADGDNKYVLTAVGPDKSGLVATLSEYLRHKQINIEDFVTCVNGGLYTMILLVALPPGTHVGKLKHSLKLAMADVGINAELQHHDIFKATNEV